MRIIISIIFTVMMNFVLTTSALAVVECYEGGTSWVMPLLTKSSLTVLIFSKKTLTYCGEIPNGHYSFKPGDILAIEDSDFGGTAVIYASIKNPGSIRPIITLQVKTVGYIGSSGNVNTYTISLEKLESIHLGSTFVGTGIPLWAQDERVMWKKRKLKIQLKNIEYDTITVEMSTF